MFVISCHPLLESRASSRRRQPHKYSSALAVGLAAQQIWRAGSVSGSSRRFSWDCQFSAGRRRNETNNEWTQSKRCSFTWSHHQAVCAECNQNKWLFRQAALYVNWQEFNPTCRCYVKVWAAWCQINKVIGKSLLQVRLLSSKYLAHCSEVVWQDVMSEFKDSTLDNKDNKCNLNQHY